MTIAITVDVYRDDGQYWTVTGVLGAHTMLAALEHVAHWGDGLKLGAPRVESIKVVRMTSSELKVRPLSPDEDMGPQFRAFLEGSS